MVVLFSWVTFSRSEGAESYAHSFLAVFINALFFFGYAYLTVYLLIPLLLLRKQFLLFLVSFILTGIALSLFKFLFSDVIFYQAIAPESSRIKGVLSLSSVLVNTKDMTFIVAVFAIAKFARDHYVIRNNIRELEQRGIEAEIKLLEHQMDPHVIFNNFNSLYSISIYRPDHLRSTVGKLKSILYYLFSESRQNLVELSREVEMIENYIGMEQLRFGDRLNIDFRVEGELSGLKIAPLILYPFVENCFVHGAGEDPRKSWIRIQLWVNEDRLRFCAANSVSDYPREHKLPGRSRTREHSLRRLELQYPNNHRMTIREKRNEHIVELNLTLGT